MVRTLSREQLAWAAGFADGESCFSRARSYRGQFQIAQKTPELLFKFRHAVGGIGYVTGPYRGHAKAYPDSTVYHYRVSNFEHVQAVTAMLWPWLGEAKRAQAKRVLERWTKKEEVIHGS